LCVVIISILKCRAGVMSLYIITNRENEGKTLNERLKKLIRVSKQVDILVGFFYLSGYNLIHKAIEENPELTMRILVGLDVGKNEDLLYEFAYNDTKSRSESMEKFFESIKVAFNDEMTDNADSYKLFQKLIEYISEGKIQIRKTREPNHSKLYIFHLADKTIRPGLFITGSSNLTKAGLNEQQEFNVEISDFGFQEAYKFFSDLWNSSIPITEKQEWKEKFIRILSQETHPGKSVSPVEAYAYILKTYIDSAIPKHPVDEFRKLLSKNNYTVFTYQIDAIKDAISKLENHSGVILADVVGLGKTVIALGIAKILREKGIVIAPPGLVNMWEEYLKQFRMRDDWEVFSIGKLDEPLEYVRENPEVSLVIVDEAHRFRNPKTKSYEKLYNICFGRKVILLTATPFNNRPSDIFSLIKLFQSSKNSTIDLSPNIESKIARFQSEYSKLLKIKKYAKLQKKQDELVRLYQEVFKKTISSIGKEEINEVEERIKKLSKEIRRFIEPVIIRRNRIDLKENPRYKEEVGQMSVVRDPIGKFYELTKEQSEFYDRVINDYFGEVGQFIGAIYTPYFYREGVFDNDESNFEYLSQKNLKDLIRRLLVKRFESSFGAFRNSVKTIMTNCERILEFIERYGYYTFDRKILEEMDELEDDEVFELIEQKLAEGLNGASKVDRNSIYDISEFKKKEEFIEHIKHDQELLQSILIEMEDLKLTEVDPKIETLKSTLYELINENPSRKIIVFTEYRDTVRYIRDHLSQEFKLLAVDNDLTNELLEKIRSNFDATVKKVKRRDDYDVLVATDKLSEGFNLARAGVVINYDIPWNPVRVIQRVGRINRIGQKIYDELYIVNFFPTEKGEEQIKQREIAETKLFLIHNALGEDAKIFSEDEEPSASKLYSKLTNYDEIERTAEGDKSPLTIAMKEFDNLKRLIPGIEERISNMPPRVKVSKKSEGNENQILFVKKNNSLFIIRYNYATQEIEDTLDLIDVLSDIRCDANCRSNKLNDRFWEAYNKLKEHLKSLEKHTKEISKNERKAYNALKTLLNHPELKSHHEVIKLLIKHIETFGGLPEATLKEIERIGKVFENSSEISSREINKLKERIDEIVNQLGGKDYLENVQLSKPKIEIMISIENTR